MLVDAEYQTRDNRRLIKLLADVEFRYPQACTVDDEPSSALGIEKPIPRRQLDAHQDGSDFAVAGPHAAESFKDSVVDQFLIKRAVPR